MRSPKVGEEVVTKVLLFHAEPRSRLQWDPRPPPLVPELRPALHRVRLSRLRSARGAPGPQCRPVGGGRSGRRSSGCSANLGQSRRPQVARPLTSACGTLVKGRSRGATSATLELKPRDRHKAEPRWQEGMRLQEGHLCSCWAREPRARTEAPRARAVPPGRRRSRSFSGLQQPRAERGSTPR